MSQKKSKNLFIVEKNDVTKKRKKEDKKVKFVVLHNSQVKSDPAPDDFSIIVENSNDINYNDINEDKFNEEPQSLANLSYPQNNEENKNCKYI